MLACHTEFSGYEAKLAKSTKDGAATWVNPEGYKNYVAAAKEKFEVLGDIPVKCL
jgi:hypothetical protein